MYVTTTKNFRKLLKKLESKDKSRFIAVSKKILEIQNCNNPHHYKNLRHNLKNLKRVHIDSHFVLLFQIIEPHMEIKLIDLQHHDAVYKR